MTSVDRARLKAARQQRGLTQHELAEKAKITLSLIGQYERGEKRPSLDNLDRLAKALEVTLPWLLGERVAEPGDDYRGSRLKPLGATAILADYEAQPGLRDLASRHDLHASLQITDAEWQALHSLKPPGELSMDGYLAILLAIRAAIRT